MRQCTPAEGGDLAWAPRCGSPRAPHPPDSLQSRAAQLRCSPNPVTHVAHHQTHRRPVKAEGKGTVCAHSSHYTTPKPPVCAQTWLPHQLACTSSDHCRHTLVIVKHITLPVAGTELRYTRPQAVMWQGGGQLRHRGDHPGLGEAGGLVPTLFTHELVFQPLFPPSGLCSALVQTPHSYQNPQGGVGGTCHADF